MRVVADPPGLVELPALLEEFKLSDENLYALSEYVGSIDLSKMMESFRDRSVDKAYYAHSVMWSFNENLYLMRLGPWADEKVIQLHFNKVKKLLTTEKFELTPTADPGKDDLQFFSDRQQRHFMRKMLKTCSRVCHSQCRSTS